MIAEHYRVDDISRKSELYHFCMSKTVQRSYFWKNIEACCFLGYTGYDTAFYETCGNIGKLEERNVERK